MKKVIFLFVLVVLCFYTNITKAQVGMGTTAPNASAVLELKSNALGFLPTRMTTTQRNAISSPAEGLVIFNTGTNCLEWYNGSSWISLCNNAVGTITCANSSIQGSYYISTALTASNYISLEVVVSQLGAWNITTNIENGCWFQGSGVFTSTGTQTITLLGRGTPSASGSFVYIPIFGAAYCSFNVNVSACSASTVSDVDGNSYNTIAIGTQCWMKENLKSTKYRNETAIPNVTLDATWYALTADAYCCYNNDCGTYNTTYGKLYNWYAVNNNYGLCPTGWHVPSNAEFCTLSTFLDPSATICSDNYETESNIVGGKLKETGTTHWTSPNTGATNSSGFTALPSGIRHNNGPFDKINDFSYWWSSTESITSDVMSRFVGYNFEYIVRSYNIKTSGFSVRCVKD